MITFETKKFIDTYWLIVRTWDGIDRPQYFKLFEITEDEMEFKSGRFDRFDNNTYINKNNEIPLNKEVDIEYILAWINENTFGKWSFDATDWFVYNIIGKFGPVPCMAIFYFEDEVDAMAFKLRWIE